VGILVAMAALYLLYCLRASRVAFLVVGGVCNVILGKLDEATKSWRHSGKSLWGRKEMGLEGKSRTSETRQAV